VLHGLQRQEEDNSNASNAIKSDLSAIKDTLHIVGQMDGISTKIEEAIKQSLQTGSKEDGEMLKGVYYSMKKLVSEFNKEKEDAILFNKQYLNSMSDLKGHIEEDFGKRLAEAIEQNAGLQDAIQTINRTLQHSVKDQNRLLLDIVGTIEKQLPFFSGKVEDSISAIAEKITAYERATLSKLTNTGADVMRFISENVINDIKDMGKRHHTLMAEVGQIKQLSSGGAKDQVDVLQGVFLSVKKLLNIATKERDTNEKVANQLTNALDNLYSQIRRLESEKDELDVELLRLAGDDYFKNKFKQLENDLHKARSLADKYQEEKMELEQKYMRLQQQWDLAQELEGR
ncbi:MAG: hypothetical protein HQK97_09225, partial [Nitrospirae bacterium]|nr:hypothetical protein [Nitrospirota bacterium]